MARKLFPVAVLSAVGGCVAESFGGPGTSGGLVSWWAAMSLVVALTSGVCVMDDSPSRSTRRR